MTRRLITAILFCVMTVSVMAQSFETLKRSTGKSRLYDVVERSLQGQASVEECKSAMTSAAFKEPYKGKTPIYLVMDYLATHPKSACERAEQILDTFLSFKGFDVNQRYSSLMPPLAYLIRTNYDYLNGKYSSDYISDSVIQKLIEAGSSVNTYNTDGGSLMSFAIATDNKFLQQYFANQGADIRHNDNQGNDDVYRMIASGNLQLLRKFVDGGSVKIDLHTLKNDPSSFAQYKEMYDYLAELCGRNISTYEDITLFRKRFSLRQDIVKDKYLALVHAEGKQAKSFSDVLKIEKRYPDLSNITSTYKRAIYDRDCSSLKSLYQRTLEVAKASSLQTMDDGSKNVNSFIDSYKEYDPASLLPLAREMQQFFTVCEALNTNTHYTYWYQSNESSIFVGDYKKFDFFSSTVKYHRERLSNAKAICKGSSKYGYSAFYAKVASQLPIVEQKMEANIARNRDEYSEAQAAYEKEKLEKLFSSASSSGGGSSRNSRSEESSVDIESIPTPKYKTEGPYDLDSFDSFMGLSGKRYIVKVDDGDDDYEIEIFLYKDTKGAWVDGLGSHGIPKQYDTFDNAVTAGYVYYKYGKVREKGEL